MSPLSRRRFLRALGLGAAGAAAYALCPGCRPRGATPAAARPPRRVLADLHAHGWIDEWNRTTPFAREYPLLVESTAPLANRTRVDWERCHAAGVDLVCVAHYNLFDEWISMPVDPNPAAYRHAVMMLDQLEGALAGPLSPYARLARDRDVLASLLAVDKSTGAFRTAVVHALEGAHALGGDIGAVEALAARGVAYMSITHFFDKGVGSTANAFPYFPDMGASAPAVGLHPFGRELIAEMERVGVIVDVTHLSETAVADALETSRRPVLASHAASRTLADRPYSLRDEHVVEIARRGGLVGVILYPFQLGNYSGTAEARRWGRLRDVVRTVRHFVKLVGPGRVAIGSDFGAYITPPRDMKRLSDVDRLRALLLDEFSDESLVDAVMAGNAIDFLMKNWGRDA